MRSHNTGLFYAFSNCYCRWRHRRCRHFDDGRCGMAVSSALLICQTLILKAAFELVERGDGCPLRWHSLSLFRGLAPYGHPVAAFFFANNSCRPSAYLASLPGTGGLQFIQIACMARCHVLHVIALSEVDEKPTCRSQATADYTA